jgi:hypothetical protein
MIISQGQEADGRRQTADGRQQTADGRRQEAEGRRLKAWEPGSEHPDVAFGEDAPLHPRALPTKFLDDFATPAASPIFYPVLFPVAHDCCTSAVLKNYFWFLSADIDNKYGQHPLAQCILCCAGTGLFVCRSSAAWSILSEVNHQLESRMRENRLSGSEGGGTTRSPYPLYQAGEAAFWALPWVINWALTAL